MSDVPPVIEARAAILWRRVYKKCQELAHQEITNEFGKAWRGGKFNAAYLSGRVPFTVLPLNSGTVTIAIPASTDPTTHGDYGTQHVTYDDPYPGTTLPSGATAGSAIANVASTAGMSVRQTVRFTQAGGSHLTETHKLTAVDHAAKNITFVGVLANTYAASDTVIVVPDVTLGSGDIGWIASRANVDNTGFDLTLARRVSLTNSEGGTVIDPATSAAPKILAGNTNVLTDPITFPTAYQAAPVVQVQTGDANYTAVAESISSTTFRVRVTHTPQGSSGQIGKSPTGIMPSAGGERTDGLGANQTALATTDTGSAGSTADNSDSTTTGASSASNTSGANQTHTHPIASPGTSTATGADTPDHVHPMGHTHPHNAGTGLHTHPVGAHTHTVADHEHNLTEPNSGAGHDHTFTGTSTAVGSDTPVPCIWIAFGTRTAPAVSKQASWIARGA